MDKTFGAVGAISGSLEAPGDKAIAHRALILAAMMTGTSRLHRFPQGAAVASTMQCLTTLGFGIRHTGDVVEVDGAGWQAPAAAALHAGNSGTTIRLLCGALAGRPGRFELTGDEYLSRRPMERVAGPLRKMGAQVSTSDGCPPIVVQGGPLAGADHDLDVPSAQVKTAILLAGLQAEGITRVREPLPSRDHTERMFDWLGARITTGGGGGPGEVAVEGDPSFFEKPGFALEIPGDFSSAAFFITLACLVKGSHLEIRGVGLNPTRTGLLEVLRAMGASIEYQVDQDDVESEGTVTVEPGLLRGAGIGGELIPRAIDELPLIALAATQAEGRTVIKDAAELRVKESNRLDVMAKGLAALGARIEPQPDGLVIEGPTPLHGGTVDAAGDHRMALLFALAGCVASEPVTVSGWECVAVSYPGFEADLAKLVPVDFGGFAASGAHKSYRRAAALNRPSAGSGERTIYKDTPPNPPTVVVAIDGPSGSGKSTVARMLAERLGAAHVDTGAMYRAFALKAMRAGVAPGDSDEVTRLLDGTAIEIARDRVTMDGEDVSSLIRTPEVTEQASLFAAIPEVRKWMVAKQRGIATSAPGITVFEGRDIGSIVFPDAALKVFVTASVEERVKRRAAETGRPPEEVREEILARDGRDTGRAHSPMLVAEGAVLVDTTGHSPESVVEQLAALAKERLS